MNEPASTPAASPEENAAAIRSLRWFAFLLAFALVALNVSALSYLAHAHSPPELDINVIRAALAGQVAFVTLAIGLIRGNIVIRLLCGCLCLWALPQIAMVMEHGGPAR